MSFLSSMRIGPRLALAFGLLIALMLSVVGIAVGNLHELDEDIDLIVHDRYVKVKLVGEVIEHLNLQARASRNALLFDEASKREEALREIAEAGRKIGAVYDKLSPLLNSERGKQLFAALQKERQDYLAAMTPFSEQVRKGEIAPALEALFARVRPQQLEYMQKLTELSDFQEELMEATGKQAHANAGRAITIMLVSALVALIIAGSAGLVVARSVTRPVDGLVRDLQAVADGDLAVEVRVNRGDEIGQLQSALETTVASLRKVVGQVRAGIDSVTTASGQIAAGNQDLSQRTEEQASSLQETASAMEELTGTVRQSADNANQASQITAQASRAAEHGGTVVGGVVRTMDGISNSSKRIADIIGTIDGIAFQTNILALNAAVEAARAGEQGRGFAVVAGEVRSLASRSAEAAKEIKALIGNSVEQVEAGTRQVADAGSAMQAIVDQVRKANELISEIAAASQEQSTGIGQVNQAVAQMDQVTQQNAALVEESAAAASSLSHQAQQLAAAIAVFRLSDGPVGQPRPIGPRSMAGSARPAAALAAPARKPAAARPALKGSARAAPASAPTAAKTLPAPAPAPKPAAQAEPADTGEWTSF